MVTVAYVFIMETERIPEWGVIQIDNTTPLGNKILNGMHNPNNEWIEIDNNDEDELRKIVEVPLPTTVDAFVTLYIDVQ